VTLLLPKGFKLEDSQVYRDAATKHGNLVWLSENDLYDRYALDAMYKPDTDIHAAAVIMDYSHRKLLGLLILSINRTYFSSISYPGELLSGGRLYLVSPDKKRVFGVAGSGDDLTGEELARMGLDGEGGQYISHDQLTVYRYSDVMGWYLVSVTRMTVLNQSVTEIVFTLLLVLVACLLLAALFSQRLALQGARGIAELIEGMEKVEHEDFDVEVPVIRQDELGRITQAFNHMVRKIRELIVTEYREKLLMQEAQFKALQSQIRPHFFMNTFDMLHWKLMENGQDALSETVVAMSHLMQYSMTSGSWEVTLAQEMANVREYVAVHTTIRGIHIHFKTDVEDGSDVCLPRQTLQPMIENAILHGFACRAHQNELLITGHWSPEGDYCLCVEDNGVGIPQEEAEALNRDLNKPDWAANQHIGLQNVAARLHYMNVGARLWVESEYGSGTRVWILLPGARRGHVDELCDH
jgi:two-component system sensor histidine kinase YesM